MKIKINWKMEIAERKYDFDLEYINKIKRLFYMMEHLVMKLKSKKMHMLEVLHIATGMLMEKL